MQGRLLIVDDEKALVLAIKGLLSKEGYQIETAYSSANCARRSSTCVTILTR